MTPRSTPLLLTASGALLALAACSSSPAASDATGSDATSSGAADSDGHGYIQGAAEMQEPQLRLVTLSGAVLSAFDPATEESVELAEFDGDVTRLETDGRYAFASSADGVLRIVDGGAWTVPHGDHSHYYLAEPRVVGEIDGGAGEARVASSATLTAAWFGDSGTGVVLDADALASGGIEERGRIEGVPHDGALLPLGDVLVGSVAEEGDERASSVAVFSADGEATGDSAECLELRGSAITRVGAVFGCADGAVLAVAGDDGVVFERIPYPEGTAAADVAGAFSSRPGRPSVAAVAGERGAWLLDTRARTWTLIPTAEPLLATSAVSDTDDTVVGLDRSGRVVALTPEGGAAATDPLLAADLVDGRLPAGVSLEVDVSRAYVNSPATGLVHEIDYDDSARLARSFALDARLLVETGR
ncbi:hypothetical protein ASF48_01805 [Rathayibacter sp. Leaf299]|uniref:hypothetical protein n=1 Tax=Rathayibacter sp. Leaf299 TaxID=1736328 RepID=UPI0006FF1DDE|nr:hypothetical protein [Rathayibacter sp. Leaf299]KQQ21996.1 hypothetical protein ASF48_01805 [Rathayibacter sp. Leaf299]